MCVCVCDREKCRSDYEARLHAELEQVRVRTDAEIDRLKTSTRDLYDRENRSGCCRALYCPVLQCRVCVCVCELTPSHYSHIAAGSSLYL